MGKSILNTFCSSGGIPLVKSFMKANGYTDYYEINATYIYGHRKTVKDLNEQFKSLKGKHFNLILINLWNYNVDFYKKKKYHFYKQLRKNNITYDKIELYFFNSMIEGYFEETYKVEVPFTNFSFNKLYNDFIPLLEDEKTTMYVDNNYEIERIKKFHNYNFKLITNATEFAKYYFNDELLSYDDSKRKKTILINNKYKCFKWYDIYDICSSLPEYNIVYTERLTYEKFRNKMEYYKNILNVDYPKNLEFVNTHDYENYIRVLEKCKDGYSFNLHCEAFGVKFFDLLKYNIKPICTKTVVSNEDVIKMCNIKIIDGFGTANNFIRNIKDDEREL